MARQLQRHAIHGVEVLKGELVKLNALQCWPLAGTTSVILPANPGKVEREAAECRPILTPYNPAAYARTERQYALRHYTNILRK
jgi:hypothetical protein